MKFNLLHYQSKLVRLFSNIKLRFRSMKNPKANLKNEIGANLRRLRYQHGFTQETFSARCGTLGLDISRGTLSKIEARLRCVSDSELRILAKALHVKMEDLFR